MARFIERGTRKPERGTGTRAALFVGALFCSSPALAANESLLAALDLAPYKWLSSTDPKNQNEDYLLLRPGETRKIPLAAGQLARLWCTALEPEKIELSLQNGQRIPLIKDGKRTQQFPGEVHARAFVAYPADLRERMATTRDHMPPWAVLRDDAHLMVTNHSRNAEGNKFFYQAAVRRAAPRKQFTGVGSLTQEKQVTLAPGQQETLELPAAGLIEAIGVSCPIAEREALRLRAAWDSSQTNAVDAPLSALVATFNGPGPAQLVENAAWSLSKGSLELQWPMPFGKARLSLVNEGRATISLRWKIQGQKFNAAPSPYRFHAVYGSARTQLKTPVRMLDVTGKGAFCGLNLSIEPAPGSARRTFAYLEGNETITADGQKFEGTGTEDFFSSAWYFPKTPFSFPYHGMTFKSEAPPKVAAYRLMIPDAMPFKKSLLFEFEHGKGNNTDDLLYRWVAFWYQEPSAKFQVTDTLSGNAPGTQSGAPQGTQNNAPTGGVSQLTVILTALVTAAIVGFGGGWLVKRSRKI